MAFSRKASIFCSLVENESDTCKYNVELNLENVHQTVSSKLKMQYCKLNWLLLQILRLDRSATKIYIKTGGIIYGDRQTEEHRPSML